MKPACGKDVKTSSRGRGQGHLNVKKMPKLCCGGKGRGHLYAIHYHAPAPRQSILFFTNSNMVTLPNLTDVLQEFPHISADKQRTVRNHLTRLIQKFSQRPKSCEHM